MVNYYCFFSNATNNANANANAKVTGFWSFTPFTFTPVYVSLIHTYWLCEATPTPTFSSLASTPSNAFNRLLPRGDTFDSLSSIPEAVFLHCASIETQDK